MAVSPPTSGKQSDKFHCHRSGYGKNGYLEALIRIAAPAGANCPSGEEIEVSGVLGETPDTGGWDGDRSVNNIKLSVSCQL